jgi:hypothetical protein
MPYGAEGPLHTIDVACATALGDLLGLDWATFHGEPAVVEWPETALDNVLGAAYTLVASNVGTIAELQEVMLPDEVAALALADPPGGRTYAPEDPAAALWVELLAEGVKRTVWNGDLPGEASFRAGVLHVEFEPGVDESLTLEEHPAYLASVIVHEASHALVSHVACDDFDSRSCDADGRGAYGAQLRWATSWVAANADSVSTQDLFGGGLCITASCLMILDTSEVEACADEGR